MRVIIHLIQNFTVQKAKDIRNKKIKIVQSTMRVENFNICVSEIDKSKNVKQAYLCTVMPLSTGNSFVKITGTSVARSRTVFILLHLSATTEPSATPPKTFSPRAPEVLRLPYFLLLRAPTQLCWLLLFLTSQYRGGPGLSLFLVSLQCLPE